MRSIFANFWIFAKFRKQDCAPRTPTEPEQSSPRRCFVTECCSCFEIRAQARFDDLLFMFWSSAGEARKRGIAEEDEAVRLEVRSGANPFLSNLNLEEPGSHQGDVFH
jgi:hypothetical protein